MRLLLIGSQFIQNQNMACGSCPDVGMTPVERIGFHGVLKDFFGEEAGCQVGSISFDSWFTETVITECFWSWTTAVSLNELRDLDTKGLDELSGISYCRKMEGLLFYLLLIARFHLTLSYNSQAQQFKVLLCSPSC